MQHQGDSARTILVTGGGGFLGKAIVRLLINRRDRVISFSRGHYSELESLGVKQVQGDISNPVAVENAVRGVDSVYHVAAKAGVWGDYKDYYRINTEGTRHVIAACKSCGVSRLIYTSSPSVVFDGGDMEGVDEAVPYPGSYHAAYPETKALAEQAVREAGGRFQTADGRRQRTGKICPAAGEGLKTIILRPHLIWGPGDNHLVPRILNRAKRLRRIGDGNNRVDVIYIDNAARAHLLAEEALIRQPELSGNVYFISQGKPVYLWKMIDDILQAGGLSPVKRSISSRAAFRIGAILEWFYKSFAIKEEPQMTRFVARELSTSHWFDIRAAQRDLGYAPEVSTEEGLIRLSAYLKTQY
ncbi:MAG: NAD-dependent epimerase/dehydratase family protein [Deltaproteobacteria bacterium]|nr:NAD-dependent epimerase/dehydratase family protein [Deltaproteobacteria bacterium]